jgi:hypothetical protein
VPVSREWESYTWAFGPRKLPDFIVYLCLAEHSNFSGLSFPSWERIIERTRLSRATVARTLGSLKADGWLTPVSVGEGGPGRGNIRSYQLIKKVSQGDPLEGEKVSQGDPLEGEKVSQGDPLEGEKVSNGGIKGLKYASLYRLTKRELKDLKTSTFGASAKLENEDSPNVRPQPDPLPPLKMPPLDPLGNPEIRNLVDLVFCASPWAVLRNLRTVDVTPKQRVAVLTAAKLEADEFEINLPDALGGLLKVVGAQVAALPRDELRFQGGETKYFSNRNYRVDAAHLTGGNGNGKLERAHPTKTDRTRAAVAENRARRAAGRGFTF